MLYGRQPVLPKEELLIQFDTTDTCAYANTLKDNLLHLHEQVRGRLKKRQEETQGRTPSTKTIQLQENDEVLVRKGKRQKMEPLYEGPYKILHKTPNGAYQLDRPNNGEPTSMINQQRLKKYHPRLNENDKPQTTTIDK